MKTKKETIEDIAASLVSGQNAYLIDVSIRGERGETVVQVLADTDEGITIARCASLSKELASRIEQEGLFDGRYRLEVSSPGLDKPLKVLRQYQKNVGRMFHVSYGHEEEEKHVTVTITDVDGEIIGAETEQGVKLRIPFGQIKTCRYRLPW